MKLRGKQSSRSLSWRKPAASAAAALAFLSLPACPAARGDSAVEAQAFDRNIRPLLREYCLKCHSTEEQKGELDLERFSSLEEVRKHPTVWESVAEHLADNEMPPKGKPQLPPEQKTQLTAWVQQKVDSLAQEYAGDPGPVVLRRLSNAEYTYTIRDLTGIDSLDPVREFPADSAAGEGFTNTGQAMVISPSLITKYLDAGREIASHAILLPDGIRFSPKTTRRDWTNDLLAQIRTFYAGFSEARGATAVNLQGIQFETNGGGRLPVESYLAATLTQREALANGGKTIEAVASEQKLSPKYLKTLWTVLNDTKPSLLLDPLRAKWRAAKPEEAGALAAEIEGWQKALWKFNSVGQIGKRGSAKSWQEAATPLVASREVRLKIPKTGPGEQVKIYLSAQSATEDNRHDFVIWDHPRLVAPGRPDLLLRDVRQVGGQLAARRAQFFGSAAQCLDAAAEAAASPEKPDLQALAQRHKIDPAALAFWCDYLGIAGDEIKIPNYLKTQIPKAEKYDFIKGWGGGDALSFVANSSDQEVRIPGKMKPHGVAMHPMPTIRVAVGWRSPLAGTVSIEAKVQRAHPECGSGVTWFLEVRRGASRQQLASGEAVDGEPIPIKPFENVAVQPGDFVSLFVGPRNGSHICGLTAVDLTITEKKEDGRAWNLAQDVSPDVLAGNPHADRLGNAGIWHFYSEPDKGAALETVISAGSVLAQWQLATGNAAERQRFAQALQTLMTSPPPAASGSPDAALYYHLVSFVGRHLVEPGAAASAEASLSTAKTGAPEAGLDPALFGKRPNGSAFDAANLCVQAPKLLEVTLPGELAEGCEFVATAKLDSEMGAEGSVQIEVLSTPPDSAGDLPGKAGQSKIISLATPILTTEGSAARARFASAMDDFREVFPAALCYTKIVPVDEVITLVLFYREDDQLARLMLDDAQKAELDRLWAELRYVSGDALTMVDAFEQIWQFATQDGDPTVLEPMRIPIKQRAAAYTQQLLDTQLKHLEAVLDFAGLAYRRPLKDSEKRELRELYAKLRSEEVPHDEAIRLTLARVFLAPAFLYRAETPGPGLKQVPVTDWELANRLSYFLWSSAPDAELRAAAAAGKLHDSDELRRQTQRMLRDPRIRRLATEFGCSWLHIHGFDTLDEKSEKQFPTFGALRGAMYEESIRFFTDLFQNNRPVSQILDADYTFLNQALAGHYGIPGVSGPEWRRVEGVKKYSRGGILTQATTLATQSGASRTSPILRGSWVAETLLGDKLPKPPKDVPRLPEEEATETLTVRQLTQKHTSDPRCAGCHARFDSFGFALENFDAIGRFREKDLADHPLDSRATTMDGADLQGLEGLRNYLLTTRRGAFMHQFCRKLLGFSLGRSVQLSDAPLLKEIEAKLAGDDHAGTAIEMIVESRQFREIRRRDFTVEE